MKSYKWLDYFRIAAAVLVVAIHTSPLTLIGVTSDFVLTRVIARVAVPFFFMVTGFFVLPKIINNESELPLRFISKTGLLYLLSIAIYIPVNIYSGYFGELSGFKLITDVVFDGTFYHLWYFPAVITGVLIVSLSSRILGRRSLLALAITLYVIGLFGDSYYGLVENSAIFSPLYEVIFSVMSYTRNGLFFAPLFIYMGYCLYEKKPRLNINYYICTALLFLVLMTVEALLLRSGGLQRHDSMYVMLAPCMYSLFCCLIKLKGEGIKRLRTISTAVYIIHPLVIIFVRGFSKLLGIDKLLIENSLIHFFAVCALSFSFGILIVPLFAGKQKSPKPPIDIRHSQRAWAEIDLINLVHNLNGIRRLLPDKTEVMAVVKANAYGHGDIAVSKELYRFGVRNFAVATVSEGVSLRKNGLGGEILVLGYSHPDELRYVYEYDLTQTLIDSEYAKAVDSIISSSNKVIKVQIKIDTGMTRLGERYKNFDQILGMYSLGSLKVTGTYTHLSRADSLDIDDIIFTRLQIKTFNDIVAELKAHGVKPCKLHVQSSYGVLNHPCAGYDFARIGIALYGTLSHTGVVSEDASFLRPVLSLKARIALIKSVSGGEAVGYGSGYIAEEDMRIAVVSIGYADGFPRSLSNRSRHVLVGGHKAKIIGNICMDQLMIDISGLNGIRRNDVVTLIGGYGAEVVHAAETAEAASTITNELLSRIGDRVVRIIV